MDQYSKCKFYIVNLYIKISLQYKEKYKKAVCMELYISTQTAFLPQIICLYFAAFSDIHPDCHSEFSSNKL